jgi:hypothetical protein
VFQAAGRATAAALLTTAVAACAAVPAPAGTRLHDPLGYSVERLGSAPVQIVRVEPAHGFQWDDAAIGAGIVAVSASVLVPAAIRVSRHRAGNPADL